MHVDSGWGKTAKTEEAVQARPRRMAAYRATLEEDAELLKIFEQTYGPSRRDPLAAFRPTQKRERPDFNAEQWEIQPEYLLVGRLQHHLCMGRAERTLQRKPGSGPPQADGHPLQLSGL